METRPIQEGLIQHDQKDEWLVGFMLSALIVDDEPLAVKRLATLLAENGVEPESCKCFLNWSDAYDYARNHQVDIAFLDISMPEIDGMKLSELLLDLNESTKIVFVTGHDTYAVQAFEAEALDYLLKPVSSERVAKTLAKFNKIQGGTISKPELTVKLFGGFKIFRGGSTSAHEALKMRSPKTEELFAFLLCHGSVRREEIIDTLWEGLEAAKAWKNLNSTLYYIRKAIGTSERGHWIVADRNEIRIDRSGLNCDLYEFEELIRQIRRQPKEDISNLCKKVESIYSGALLKGKAYDWAAGKIIQLERDYTEVLEMTAESHLKHHRVQDALHYYSEILKIDPLREDIAYQVLLIYLKLGRIHEALRYYEAFEKLLGQELGISPGPRVKQLIEQLNKPGRD